MRLDGATIPIEKRTVGEGIDLAVRLCIAEARSLALLVAVFATPACALVYTLTWLFGFGLVWAALFFGLLSPVLGAFIVAGMGPRVFGEELSLRAASRLLRERLGAILFALWGPRLAWGLVVVALAVLHPWAAVMISLAVLVPFAGARSSVVREVILLEQLHGDEYRQRVRDLRRGNLSAQVVWHLGAVAVLGFASVTLFLIADIFATWVLGAPMVYGRIPLLEDELDLADLLYQIRVEPLPITVASAFAWLCYPVARTVMFLSYLDIRITRECWDLNLDFRIEAAKLEASAG